MSIRVFSALPSNQKKRAHRRELEHLMCTKFLLPFLVNYAFCQTDRSDHARQDVCEEAPTLQASEAQVETYSHKHACQKSVGPWFLLRSFSEFTGYSAGRALLERWPYALTQLFLLSHWEYKLGANKNLQLEYFIEVS